MVTTFATPEPEIVPIKLEEIIDTLAGPPNLCPTRPSDTSVNNFITPARSKKDPNKINKKINVDDT